MGSQFGTKMMHLNSSGLKLVFFLDFLTLKRTEGIQKIC